MTSQLFHFALRTLRQAILKDKARAEAGWRSRPRYVLLSTSGSVILSDAMRPGFEIILLVARLIDGRIFVVEYKGAMLASGADTKEKTLVGQLWASSGPERQATSLPQSRR